jgi:hypothetical protein
LASKNALRSSLSPPETAMYAYLALVSEAPLDRPEVDARVAAAARRSLGWVKDLSEATWRSPTRRTRIWWWTNEPRPLTGSVTTSEDAALIVLGALDADLTELLHARDLPRSLVGLAGDYSLCRLADDEAIAISTFTRQTPVYSARAGEISIVTNRALLGHLFCRDGRPLAFDLDCLATPVATSYAIGGFWSDRTPFHGIALAQPNSVLHVTADHVRSVDNHGAYGRFGTGDGVPDDSYFDDLAEVFLAGLRRLDLPPAMDVALTGGKDSRVLVSAMTNLGLDLAVSTVGFETDPDVVVAKRVAAELGLPHTHVMPATSNETQEATLAWDLQGNVARELLVYDAMMFTVAGLPRRASNRGVTVDAQFRDTAVLSTKGAEIWRSGYANRDFSWIPPNVAAEDVTSEYVAREVRSIWLWNAPLLSPEIRERHEAYVSRWLSASGIDDQPTAAAERFYLEFEIGRRDPPNLFGYLLAQPTYQPFMQQEIVRKIGDLAVRYRRDDHIHYELIKRFAPGIENIPLERKRWGFEWLAPRSESERAAWEAREPLPVTPRTYGAWPFYGAVGADYAAPIAEQLFAFDDDHNVWSFLSRDVLRDLFFSERIFDPQISAAFLVVYGLSVLMEGEWLEPEQPELVIHARHRVPWPAIYGELVRSARAEQDSFLGELETALLDLDDEDESVARSPLGPRPVINGAAFAEATAHPGRGRTMSVEASRDGAGWRVIVESEPGSDASNSWVGLSVAALDEPNRLSLRVRMTYRGVEPVVATSYLVRYCDGEKLEIPGPPLRFGPDLHTQEHTFERLGPPLPDGADATYVLLLGLGPEATEVEFEDVSATAFARPAPKDIVLGLVRDGCDRIRSALEDRIEQLAEEHELSDEQVSDLRDRIGLRDLLPVPESDTAEKLISGDLEFAEEMHRVADGLLQRLMACAP